MDKINTAMHGAAQTAINSDGSDPVEQLILQQEHNTSNTSNASSDDSTQWSQWSQAIMDASEFKADPRVDGWIFMDSLWPTLILSGIYLLFVLWLGPLFMKNREAFCLKNPMLVYNLVQTLFSAWVFQAGAYAWIWEYDRLCQAVDYSMSPKALYALRMSWWYFFSKFIDFFDTFVFVLRKKNSQITSLHIIHHSTIPIFAWFGAKYAGGGNTSFGGTLNMMVHMVMYFYYFLAALGVRKEMLWWKKYLTTMQMIQFVLITVHALIPLTLVKCDYPKGLSYIIIFNGVLYLCLFWNFYQSAYRKKPNHQTKSKAQ